MLIDWFTVIAQLINFLVLVWLLKRFLYQPILKAIDDREQKIAKQLTNAAELKNQAQQQWHEFKQKNVTFDQQQAARGTELAAEIKVERTRLLEEVRLESEALRCTLRSALDAEQLNLQKAFSLGARQEVFAIARKVLGDLADVSLEAAMIKTFIQRLAGLQGEALSTLKSALTSSTDSLLVRTAFTVFAEQRQSVEIAIQNTLGLAAANQERFIKFETETDLVSGIELQAKGQKFAWSITDYLDALTHSLDQLLQLQQPTKQPKKQESHASIH